MTDKQLSDTTATLLTPGDAARMLHVTTKTLQRMAQRGDLAAVLLPSGHRRYRQADVEALLSPVAIGGAA